MLFPEKMLLVNSLFPGVYAERVVDMLLRHGEIQLVDAIQVNPWLRDLARPYFTEEPLRPKEISIKVERIVKDYNLDAKLSGLQPLEGSWEDIERGVKSVLDAIDEEVAKKESLTQEIQRLSEIKERFERFPGLSKALKVSGDYSYLAIETGQIPEVNLPLLEQNLNTVLHVVLPFGTQKGFMTIAAIVLKRDAEVLQSALRKVGFQPSKMDQEITELATVSIEGIDKNLGDLKARLEKVDSKINQIIEQNGELLVRSYLRIRQDQLFNQMLHLFHRTEHTCLFSGWLPKEDEDQFVKKLQEATDNRAIIELIPAESIEAVKEGKLEVPVKLRNPAFFKPFEVLTKAYGLPRYQTVDPTPFLGISFLLMFGLMFGDIGHGIVLALLGLLLSLKAKKDNYKSAGRLISYAGVASIIFGFLYGSIFGIEDILPTIWLRPLSNINILFKTVIYFGACLITLSVGLNLLNGIRQGNFLEYIFDKAGLLSLILYWCGIILVTRLIFARTGEGVGLLVFYLFWFCLVLLFFRRPILNLIKKQRRLFEEGVFTTIVHALVEILEIILGYLANTVSFIRVGAFGLAHVGLFMAIFALSDLVSGKLVGIPSFIIQVIGNVFIIGLEGLIVSIQAIRLEFYEFFSRFFRTTRSQYKPIGEKLKV